MPMIFARQPAMTRLTKATPGQGAVIVPNRMYVGGNRPPRYIINDTFGESNIERFYDEFNRTDPAPWVANTANVIVQIVDNELEVTASGGTIQNARYASVATKAGSWYRLTWTMYRSAGTGFVELRPVRGSDANYLGFNDRSTTSTTPVQFEAYFQADNTSLDFLAQVNDDGASARFDNILIEEIPALDGWEADFDAALSVNNGELIAESAGNANAARALKPFPVPTNTDYIFKVDRTGGDASTQTVGISPDNTIGSSLTQQNLTNGESATLSFNSGANTTLNVVLLGGTVSGQAAIYDNVTVEESALANPTFDTDLSGWTNTDPVNITWSGGTVKWSGAQTGNGDITQSIQGASGELWEFEIKVDALSAEVRVIANETVQQEIITSTGVHKFQLRFSNGSTVFLRCVPGQTATVDYLIARKVRI